MAQRNLELVWYEGPNYLVGGTSVYDAEDLIYLMQVSEGDRPQYNIPVTDDWTRQFRTRPLYLITSHGYILLDSNPLRIVDTNLESPLTFQIEGAAQIMIPDLHRTGTPETIFPSFDQTGIAPMHVRPFDERLRNEIDRLVDGGESLRDSELIIRELSSVPIPAVNEGNPLQPILETLIARLYGLPVTVPTHLVVNGLSAPLISFEEAGRLISQGEIQQWTIDILNQVWAGPPETENRIVTLLHRDGTLSVVRARVDPISKMIFPPVD